MKTTSPTPRHWLVLVLLAMIWGGSFLMIKKAVQVFSPLQMTAWRMFLALLIYAPVGLAYRDKIDWSKWKYYIAVAMFGSVIPNFMYSIAQQHIGSGVAGALNALTPIFTLVLGVAFFKMPYSHYKLAGVLLGWSGAAVLILMNSHSSIHGNAGYAVLCALATIFYGLNANFVNAHLRDGHPAGIAAASFILTGPLFAGMLWQSQGWQAVQQHEHGWQALGYVFYLSAVSTVVGSIVYFWLLQRTSALFATSVTYLAPIMALFIGMLDGEGLAWTDIVGAAIILSGVYLARK